MSQSFRRQDLEIRIVLSGGEPERLNRLQRAFQAAEQVNIRNLRLAGQLQQAFQRAAAAQRTFEQQGAPVAGARFAAQAQTILNTIDRLNSRLTSPIGQNDRYERFLARQAKAQSELARSTGDYAGAINVLQAQMQRLRQGGEAYISLQTRINNLNRQAAGNVRFPSLLSQERGVARGALAQASVFRGAGQFAGEQQILNEAIQRVRVGSEAYLRILNRIISSERAQGAAADAHTRATERQTRAQERHNDALARRAILEARVLRSGGNNQGALGVLNAAIGAAPGGSGAQLRLQEARNQTQAAIDAGSGGGLGAVAAGLTRAVAVTFLWLYAIRQVGGAITSLILSPLEAIVKTTLKATDEFRRLEITLGGVLGSRAAARRLRSDVEVAGAGLPSTLLEQLGAIRGLAYTPATSRTLQEPIGRQGEIRKLLGVLQGLATIDPEQGLPGARFAVREALAGEFRSLRFRFEVAPEVIAASIGKNLSELKADPSLVIPALEAFVNTFIGQEAIEQLKGLLSEQGRQMRGALEEFFNLVGERGFYDRTVGLLRGITQPFLEGIRGNDPEVVAAADSINTSLTLLLDTVVDAISEFVSAVTGKRIDINNALKSGEAGQIADLLADLTRGLTSLTATIVLVVGDLLEAAGKLGRATGLIGPTSIDEINSELDAINVQLGPRRGAAAALGPFLPQLGSFGGVAQAAFFGNILPPGNVGRDDDLLRRERYLLNRRRILQGIIGPTGRDPSVVAQPGDAVSETGRAIGAEASLRANALTKLAEDARFLPSVIADFQRALGDAFDPDNRESIVAIMRRAQEEGIVSPELKSQFEAGAGGILRAGIDARGQLIERFAKEASSLPPRVLRTEFTQLAGAFQRPLPFTETLGAGGGLGIEPEKLDNLVQAATGFAKAMVDAGIATDKDKQIVDDLFDTLQGRLTDPAVQAVIGPEAADRLIGIVKDASAQVQDEFARLYDNLRDITDQFGQDLSAAFQTGFADALVDLMDGTADEIGEIFQTLGESIQRAIANAIIEATLIRGIINPLINTALYGASNPVNAQGAAIGLPTVSTPQAMGGINRGAMVIGAANGVLTRNNTMIRTVEDGHSEMAVVPVGRFGGIPVKFLSSPRGGGGGQPVEITIVNTVDSGDIVARGVASRPNVVINTVNRDMTARGQTSRTVRMVARR